MAENVGLVTLPVLRFVDANGQPLAGAKLYSYIAETTTPKALYTSPAGATAHANPAVADAAGQLVAYAIINEPYKLDLFDANDVHQDGWPIDNYSVTSSSGGTFVPVAEGGTTPGVGTYGNRVGVYKQFGPLVFFTSYMEVNEHTGTGDLLITGFPFQAASDSIVSVIMHAFDAATDGPIVGYLTSVVPTRVTIYTNVLATSALEPVNLPSLVADTSVFVLICSGTYVI